MESNEEPQKLTAFGRMVERRLNELGRDKKWLCRMLYISHNTRYSEEKINELLRSDRIGRGIEFSIGQILTEEKERQHLKKVIGIKR